MGLGEVYNKEAIVDLSYVQSIGISVARVKHVRISEISFILSPSRSSHEIVTVNDV